MRYLWSLSRHAGSLFSAWGILACELLVVACGILVPWPGISPWSPALGLQSLSYSSVQSLSHVQLFVTEWTVARQASLSITNSQSLLKLMSIKLMMPSNHCSLCCPILLQSFPASWSFPRSQFFASGGQSIGASASASVLPMNTQDWSLLGLTGLISLQSKGHSRVFSNTTGPPRKSWV